MGSLSNEANTKPTSNKTDWLNPLNRLIFQQAFRRKLPSVKLNDGRIFDLTYHDFKPAVTNSFPVVTVKPRPPALVPRGTFPLKEVLKLEWLVPPKESKFL